MIENRNYLIAIVLSFVVLTTWHYTVNIPEMERQQQAQQLAQEQAALQSPDGAGAQDGVGIPQPGNTAADTGVPTAPGVAPPLDRQAAIGSSTRIAIETPQIRGSISLTGGRIDDVVLRQYRETVEPDSDQIVLLSPSGGPDPYYAEFGFVGAAGQQLPLPDAQTVWTVESGDRLTPSTPVTLKYETGDLTFRRTIAVDDKFLFTVTDTVTNATGAPVTLFPYGLISRHGMPTRRISTSCTKA